MNNEELIKLIQDMRPLLLGHEPTCPKHRSWGGISIVRNNPCNCGRSDIEHRIELAINNK